MVALQHQVVIATAIAVPIAVGAHGGGPSLNQRIINQNAFYNFVRLHTAPSGGGGSVGGGVD